MHISEGVLSAPVLIAGGVLSICCVTAGLRKLEYEKVPQVAVLTSAFFVASLIHVPVGPSSTHLILNGLTGILLGWAAFPAIFTALTLQAVFFQFGGFTSLGVNTFNMAFPALVSFWLFSIFVSKNNRRITMFAGFIGGAAGVLGACFLVAVSLLTSGKAFLPLVKLLAAVHLPVILIEGLITALALGFLQKVKPELLDRRI
ncbi:cobalt transporter CbiM [bacterium]|nr:cobalt transporter CbiM [bacterium]